MTKPLFIQNVLGLILVLCIVFIADYLSLDHMMLPENFESDKNSNKVLHES